MWTLADNSIKGIVCNMGGDDSYRVLPDIDSSVITNNPNLAIAYALGEAVNDEL